METLNGPVRRKSLKLFHSCGVQWVKRRENVAMLNGPARYFDAVSFWLNRKPVMTAMMVWLLVFGTPVVMAGITVWRVDVTCAMAQLDPANGAQGAAETSNQSDALALQSKMDMGVVPKDSETDCPCAASSKWHWQVI
jgi:hypothetical protein